MNAKQRGIEGAARDVGAGERRAGEVRTEDGREGTAYRVPPTAGCGQDAPDPGHDARSFGGSSAPASSVWRWTFRGFHGWASVAVRVPGQGRAGMIVGVSERVARRLNRLACPCRDCVCGEAIAHPGELYLAGSRRPAWFVRLPERGALVQGRRG